MNPETKALTMWLKTLIEMKNKMKTSKYTPFGEEWKKELSKLSKKDIIEIAQGIGNENQRSLTGDSGEQITTFVQWLEDNHSIHIHDMIVTDFLRYGK